MSEYGIIFTFDPDSVLGLLNRMDMGDIICEDGGSVYLLNVSNFVHIHTVQQLKVRINTKSST
jgi:hypothetical protein